jgi:2-keto-4-pentenoate hydratase/2-oxohepta-3-ene-1,7-dioic acid hydratase in catechol pathway
MQKIAKLPFRLFGGSSLKFVRYTVGGPVFYGILEHHKERDNENNIENNQDNVLNYQRNSIDDSMIVRHIDGSPFTTFAITNKTYEIESVRLLEPTVPSKIIAVGLNYTDHAQELGMPLPENPLIFLKPPSSVLGPNDEIIYPDMSEQVEYEAELAIIIKDTVRQVSVERAMSHVLGYTCANDVTARDLQKKDGQWTRAKSFDTFAPVGPCIATDIDTENLTIKLRLNGEVKQSSTTANMIFKPAYLVSFISHIMTLCPGDVILTGTPPGVGPMLAGDTVEVSIEGIGTLTNKVIKL